MKYLILTMALLLFDNSEYIENEKIIDIALCSTFSETAKVNLITIFKNGKVILQQGIGIDTINPKCLIQLIESDTCFINSDRVNEIKNNLYFLCNKTIKDSNFFVKDTWKYFVRTKNCKKSGFAFDGTKDGQIIGRIYFSFFPDLLLTNPN